MQKWYPEVFEEFEVLSVFDLLLQYLRSGRIQLDKSVHGDIPTTIHDPCNYGRKSLKAFGHGYFEEGREIARYCVSDLRELQPNRRGGYCCGAGGGAWAMPFGDERVYYGRIKARQIEEVGAEMVVAPCHNCRDQIKKSLNKEYDLGIKTKYLWELVADALVLPEQKEHPEHEEQV